MQLKLWPWRYPWSDPPTPLLALLLSEARAGVKVEYHFCGKPIR
jgi:hypothetical protein